MLFPSSMAPGTLFGDLGWICQLRASLDCFRLHMLTYWVGRHTIRTSHSVLRNLVHLPLPFLSALFCHRTSRQISKSYVQLILHCSSHASTPSNQTPHISRTLAVATLRQVLFPAIFRRGSPIRVWKYYRRRSFHQSGTAIYPFLRWVNLETLCLWVIQLAITTS